MDNCNSKCDDRRGGATGFHAPHSRSRRQIRSSRVLLTGFEVSKHCLKTVRRRNRFFPCSTRNDRAYVPARAQSYYRCNGANAKDGMYIPGKILWQLWRSDSPIEEADQLERVVCVPSPADYS